MTFKKIHFTPIILLALLWLPACIRSHKGESQPQVQTQDTLKVATLYGPVSYFIYKGEELGLDFENVKRFAEDHGYALKIEVASSMSALLKMLGEGKIDLAAFPIPVIEEYKNIALPCGLREITYQVLVQPISDSPINDVTQLIGKDIFVEEDSKYFYRLLNLNEELGGGINIHPLATDSLMPEELIRMVETRAIPLTVIDSDIAHVNKVYYPSIDTHLKISFDQYSAWAVKVGNDSLAHLVNNWEEKKETTELMREIYRKYYEYSKVDNPAMISEESLDKFFASKNGVPYEYLFKKHSSEANQDWTLLAAIAYNESNYETDVQSRFGATGIMQLMPATAATFGIKAEELLNPDLNILGASRLLNKLDDSLKEKIQDKDERFKFVIAAYNSGLGHILDAMALAEKLGLDPSKWTGNVSEAALLKSKPKYYNDPVVKNGFFRAQETLAFVENVTFVYNYLKEKNNKSTII